MSLFLSPTVVMPQCLSQAAIWSRSQELAPKVRTFLVSRSAGTQTTWLSEWTSMAAALGLTIGIEAAGLRAEGARRFALRRAITGLPRSEDRLRAKTCRRGAGGDRGKEQIPQGIRRTGHQQRGRILPRPCWQSGHEGTNVRTAGIRADNQEY